jgi:predicted RNA-binding Zn ribbon-like protein
MAFQLIAGHPALDFVNTLDWRFGSKAPLDLLTNYDDLIRFTEESKLLSSKHARQLRPSARVLRSCRELREALAEIFYARLDGRKPAGAAQRTIERHFKAARDGQKLNWNQSPHVKWEWADLASDAELPLRTLALSALDLMTSENVERVRACNSTECRWLFLDTTKNHTRRWCSMELCGNRMKARRFKLARRRLTGVQKQ